MVVAPTPLRSGLIDSDKLPATVQTLSADDFARAGSLSVTDALEQRVAGVSLSDTQGNGFTRDLNFRGFTASPLQGTPEGLAVYMDGVRLNEAFGDTVNWDLIPEAAIARADIFTSNPAFGLNALGGAVSLHMKTGRDLQGVRLSLQGGSFGRVEGSAEAGASSGPWSVYLAGDGGREDGWRLNSPSSVARGYADLGWSEGRGELHLTAAGAVNSFGVVGPTPADLLSQDRRAVYTYPQTTANHEALVALNGRYSPGGGWTLAGDLYLRRFNQHHVDGNNGDFEGCADDPADPLYDTLCVQSDGFPPALAPPPEAFQVLGPGGAPVACPPLRPGQTSPCAGVPYGSLDRTRTQSTSWGGQVQATRSAALAGRRNVLVLGASLDQSRIRFSASSTLGVINPDLSVGPSAGIPGSGELIHTGSAIAYSPVELSARTSYWGLYGADTLDLLPGLSATVSGRLNIARIAMTDLTGSSPDLSGRHRFDRLDPAAGLAWKVSPALTVYGGYAETNRAPTPLELACSDPLRPCLLENALVADPPLKQVVAHTFEGGLRGAPALGAGRLDWRLSLFQADNDNDIIALASAIQGRGSYANAPKTRRRGLEASLGFTSARWLLYAAYSRIDATYRFSGALPSPNSPFADADGNVQVRPGDHIGGIPQDRFKAGADFRPIAAVTLGADLVATGSQVLVGDEANQDRRLPAWWSANLHGSVRLGRGIELFGRVDNLFDRRFATYGTYFETDALDNLASSPLPASPDPRSYTPAAPRSILVGLRASW